MPPPPKAPKDDHVLRRHNLRPPSQSRAECNRAVYSLPHSSSCFSSYCCLTPSARKKKMVCTFTPQAMETFHVSEQTLRFGSTDKRDAVLGAHSDFISFFAHACSEFGITIRLKKTKILGQEVSSTPSISIGDYTLKAVEDFSCLGSIISSNLPQDTELDKEDLGQHHTYIHTLLRLPSTGLFSHNVNYYIIW